MHMIKYLFVLALCITVAVAAEWYREYENGLQAMKEQQWEKAAQYFRDALKEKGEDKQKTRTYGMHFIEYFPHRELGVCYYHLGRMDEAQRELNISLQQEPSPRARDFMKLVTGGVPPPQRERAEKGKPGGVKPGTRQDVGVAGVAGGIKKQPPIPAESVPVKDTEMIVGKQTIKLVGERMGVAVLPFENKGASRDLGEIVLDKMITVMVNQERFKVMERAQLNRILEEQSLGSSGVIDAATAAQIGKGIGVDAIIIGSVAAAVSGAISVDARVIDTESAAIIVAHDIYSGSSDAQSVKNAVENLARKITESLPLVEGYVIRIDNENVVLDIGRIGGLKKGLKCIVYKEGAPMIHPITGEVLGKETQIVGEVLITDAFDKYSVAKLLTTQGGVISIGDKFLTK
jgi:hypothetical protein